MKIPKGFKMPRMVVPTSHQPKIRSMPNVPSIRNTQMESGSSQEISPKK